VAAREYEILPRNRFFQSMCGMVREWQTQDVVLFGEKVDCLELQRLRDRIKSGGGTPPSYTALVLKAISMALRDHPKANRLIFKRIFFRRLVQLNDVHAMVAVEREVGGVDMAYGTILRHTDRKDAVEITAELAALSRDSSHDPTWKLLNAFPPSVLPILVRCTALTPALWLKFRGGSFVLTSPAKYGVESIAVKNGFPLTFSFGEIKPTPMVVEGAVVPRPACTVTMSFDRLLAPGAPLARFFHDVVDRLQRADFGGLAASASAGSSQAPSQAEAP
jgi:pyruvate/2-oxoglutarate dehydrogenase complex dihydrolipoamide acyltransferase (E2) component